MGSALHLGEKGLYEDDDDAAYPEPYPCEPEQPATGTYIENTTLAEDIERISRHKQRHGKCEHGQHARAHRRCVATDSQQGLELTICRA